MITLDQIKQLDFKVRKAIDKINSLKSSNEILQEKLDIYQIRIEELEVLIDTFKEDQGAIEHGIIDALNQLDILEDTPNEKLEQAEIPSDDDESDKEITESTDESTDKNKSESSNEPEKKTDQIIPEGNTEEEDKEDISTDSEIELDIF